MIPYLQPKNLADAITVYDCVDSTNILAKEMAVAGARHGTTVIANEQIAGKGRYGRDFSSPPDSGLYMSIVLCPRQLQLDVPTLITASVAVSVCEAIEEMSDTNPQIKWVNDIFIGGKKVCGISTEAAMDFESGTMQWIVVGIGINVNSPVGELTCDGRNSIGAITAPGQQPVSRNQLAASIISKILSPAGKDSQAQMLARYKQRMFILGEVVTVSGQGDPFEAVAIDLDDRGQLIVRRGGGEVLTLASGEVSVRPVHSGA
jgi:BirA family biotin operon repressor/biotin-[acetyl-CoA-carboxylase] ligase